MVLEQATSDDAFPPDSPDGVTDDPQLSNSASSAKYRLSHMPGPIPIIGPLFGFNRARFISACSKQLEVAGQVMQRAPNNDEAQAICYHTCKELRIASAGPAIGALGGAWRANATASTWNLPFLKMWEGFDPEEFGQKGRPILKGEAAKSAWRAIRYSLYCANGTLIGMVLFASYATAVGAVGMRQDSRLKSYTQAIVKKIEESRTEAKRQGQERVGRRSDGVLSQAGTQQAPQPSKSSREWDDASPTGGEFATESTYSMEASPNNQIPASSASSSTPMYTQRPARQMQPSPREQPQGSKQQTAGGFFDDVDDASPTAQTIPARSSGQTNASGGSAWDRIRRGGINAPIPPKPSDNARKPGGPNQSDGSYSSSEADKQWAQTEAQKEFDERIERERRGGDFGSSGSGGSKW